MGFYCVGVSAGEVYGDGAAYGLAVEDLEEGGG